MKNTFLSYSTGYSKKFYELIDYGGMVDNYDIVDKDRVGVIGWSHGGLIALMDTTTMNTEKSSQQNFISAKPHTIT